MNVDLKTKRRELIEEVVKVSNKYSPNKKYQANMED